MKTILTIGYESANLDDFLETLKLARADLLLDVRELPISRRKGFSKNALKDALSVAGIEYVHEKRLGSPKDIRDRLREDHDYQVYFKQFDAYLDTQHELLEELCENIKGNVVLLCYERDYRQCHRSSVARELGKLANIKPKHLGVHGYEQRKAYKATHKNISQGISPA